MPDGTARHIFTILAKFSTRHSVTNLIMGFHKTNLQLYLLSAMPEVDYMYVYSCACTILSNFEAVQLYTSPELCVCDGGLVHTHSHRHTAVCTLR
jgi:hypothetical protein